MAVGRSVHIALLQLTRKSQSVAKKSRREALFHRPVGFISYGVKTMFNLVCKMLSTIYIVQVQNHTSGVKEGTRSPAATTTWRLNQAWRRGRARAPWPRRPASRKSCSST